MVHQLEFSSVKEFWQGCSGVDLAFVVFHDQDAPGTNYLDAIGDTKDGEGCYLVDASRLSGPCSDRFLVHNPISKRINPAWEGKIRLPYALSAIPGIGFISSAYEVTEVPTMLAKSRHELEVFKRGLPGRPWKAKNV